MGGFWGAVLVLVVCNQFDFERDGLLIPLRDRAEL
jgi:hypothetical protein